MLKQYSESQMSSEVNLYGRLMLFDLSVRGHHPSYIKHLIRGWHHSGYREKLLVVVSPLFFKEHADVVELPQALGLDSVQFIAISPQEDAALRSRRSGLWRAMRSFQEWNLLSRYVRKLNATECFLPYFDTFQTPLVFGRSLPCPLSGIYFRPTFHYPAFASYQPSYKDILQHQRERLQIRRVLSHAKLHALYCLDPFAVDWLQRQYVTKKVIALPDPIELHEPQVDAMAKLRENFCIDPHRQVFLLFGAITARKGIYQLLEAIEKLSPDMCQQLCLAIVGESKIVKNLAPRIHNLCAKTPVQVIQNYQFVSDESVATYFQLADVILALYQKHVGMSGILLQAAAAQTPVLSSNYGLMGEMTHRYGLGLAIDSTDPEAIAKGLAHCLITPKEHLCQPDKMRQFAAQNTAEQFAKVIFKHLLTTTNTN